MLDLKIVFRNFPKNDNEYFLYLYYNYLIRGIP